MTETPDGGQVSETQRLDDADANTPISDGDATAAYPDSESGSPDEGTEIGPDARTGSEHTLKPEESEDD